MTEKRFEMVITGADGSFHYLDKNTGEKITSTLELENKLNELNDENEQLKESVYSWSKSYNRVYEENTNIKHTIKTMIKTERTELGQSVLKQLWEQIE